jgi:acetyltransferase-like isoleucine patch superfamily enzyme
VELCQRATGEKIVNISTTAKIHDSVTFGPNCTNVTIGHGARINRDVYIDVKDLTIGDYVTIHHGTVLHGDKITIGHNCWIGHYCILDGHGGLLFIGNNVGVGAQSQLWSHMKFGDTLNGCRWHRMDNLVIEDDVWLVGHCVVTPITARQGSMLMVGGMATKDMEANHVYAGSPAKDMTDKFGQQFAPTTPQQRISGFDKLVAEYADQGNDVSWVSVVDGLWPQIVSNKVTYFNPTRMEYMPRYTSNETALMQFLLYDRAKFLPVQ